jgi:hypothetical protein
MPPLVSANERAPAMLITPARWPVTGFFSPESLKKNALAPQNRPEKINVSEGSLFQVRLIFRL